MSIGFMSSNYPPHLSPEQNLKTNSFIYNQYNSPSSPPLETMQGRDSPNPANLTPQKKFPARAQSSFNLHANKGHISRSLFQPPPLIRGGSLDTLLTSQYGRQSAPEKPPFSFPCLIGMALLTSPQGKLAVKDIYKYICDNFPYFLTAKPGWKNSVRHNLSLNKYFVKIERSEFDEGKGALWGITPGLEEGLTRDIQNAESRNPDKVALSRRGSAASELSPFSFERSNQEMQTVPVSSPSTFQHQPQQQQQQYSSSQQQFNPQLSQGFSFGYQAGSFQSSMNQGASSDFLPMFHNEPRLSDSFLETNRKEITALSPEIFDALAQDMHLDDAEFMNFADFLTQDETLMEFEQDLVEVPTGSFMFDEQIFAQ